MLLHVHLKYRSWRFLIQLIATTILGKWKCFIGFWFICHECVHKQNVENHGKLLLCSGGYDKRNMANVFLIIPAWGRSRLILSCHIPMGDDHIFLMHRLHPCDHSILNYYHAWGRVGLNRLAPISNTVFRDRCVRGTRRKEISGITLH